jgi:hypothetical protein
MTLHLASAQERLAREKALKYALLVSVDLKQLQGTPIPTDMDLKQPVVVYEGDHGGMLLPEAKLTSEAFAKAGDKIVPIGQLSKSTVSTLCGQLKKDFEQWQNRDLTKHKILYLFCDGIYLRLRPEDELAAAVLCAYGIREDGKKVLLHLAVGDKESTVCSKSFFQDMKQRGLAEPLLVILDGNSGLRKAVRDCFPGSWVQRCQVHRMRNILCKLPEKARPGIKPSGLSLLFAVLVDASASWRGVGVTPSANRELEVLRTNAKTRQVVRLAA